MARGCTMVGLLLVALLAAVPQQAAAGKGKGMPAYAPMGKGGDVQTDVQCNQVCNDVCTPVPQKVCNDVPYQTQQCNQVPVQQTKTQCNRVCQQTYTQSIGDSGKGGYVQSYGKGKGRHLLGLIHSMLAGKGGGHVAPQPSHGKGYSGGQQLVSNNCNDVCNEVPYTTYQTKCNTITQTRSVCDIVYQQQCNKVCKPVCQRVTTITTTQQISGGKGMPVMSGKGKWGKKL